MFWNETREDILNNIANYIYHGAYPFCAEPSFVHELEDFVEPDRCELEKLMHKSGINCMAYLYNHNVDAYNSGLTKRVHNGNLVRDIGVRMGSYAAKFIQNVGLKNSPDIASLLYGTTYNPAILDMGKNAAGYCMYGEKDVLVLYSAGASAFNSVHNFYHEMSHALQKKLKLDVADNKLLNVWATRAKNSRGKAQQSAKRIYDNECNYINYTKEAQAEVFGATMMLLRSRTEREYQHTRHQLIKYAAMRMHNGRGSGRADYNFYRPLMSVLDKLDNLGRLGRAEFGKVNGRFSLDKVANFVHGEVKQNLLSREEYNTYRSSKEPLEQLVNNYQGESKYKWLEEAQICENVIANNAHELNVVSLANDLTKAKSQRQIYDVFMDYQDVVPEAANLYELYKQHNPKGRYYDKLRKTEENFGVDRLFGALAKSRRALGAKIMSGLTGGRR